MSKTWVVALLCVALPCTQALAVPASEYAVKAAFVHNIAKFVEWPRPVVRGGKLRLCILGTDPIGEAIAVLHGKPVGGMSWEVRNIDHTANIKTCQVLFIAASEGGDIGRIQQRINGSAVLTVGDTRGYAEQGVMINLYIEDSKVRFEINRDAATRAGLRIGSQLLRLGRIVVEQGGAK